MGVRSDLVVIELPVGVKDCNGGGGKDFRVVSLKEGRGTRWVAKKSDAGTSPVGDGTMHIVPPVMIIRTRDSDNVDVWPSPSKVCGCIGT